MGSGPLNIPLPINAYLVTRGIYIIQGFFTHFLKFCFIHLYK